MIQKHMEQILQQQILVYWCDIFPMFMFINHEKFEFGRTKYDYENKYWNMNSIAVTKSFKTAV